MKKLLSSLLLAGVAVFGAHAAQTAAAESKIVLKNQADTLAYYLGAAQGAAYNNSIRQQATAAQYPSVRSNYLHGLQAALDADTAATEFYDGFNAGRSMVEAMKEMKSNGFPVNVALFRKAFTDAFLSDDLSEAELAELMGAVQTLMTPIGQKIEQRRKEAQNVSRQEADKALEANLEAGKKYIDSLKKIDKKYVTSPSGLVYKITKAGKGDKLGASQKADVRYTGKFVDGKVFDSSGDRTVTFGPSDVIKGFGEGLQLLGKGGKATLVIPADLAYGNNAPPVIGPGQTLIFEIEVVDIHP